MKNTYKLNEKVIIGNCDYAMSRELNGATGRVGQIKYGKYDYLIVFADGVNGAFNNDELLPIPLKVENHLIINSPTFNLSELTLGSLIYINKGYLQLQGFIAAITPFQLTLGYYDELSQIILSLETVDIKDVVSGKHTIELIRKAIPLELQGA